MHCNHFHSFQSSLLFVCRSVLSPDNMSSLHSIGSKATKWNAFGNGNGLSNDWCVIYVIESPKLDSEFSLSSQSIWIWGMHQFYSTTHILKSLLLVRYIGSKFRNWMHRALGMLCYEYKPNNGFDVMLNAYVPFWQCNVRCDGFSVFWSLYCFETSRFIVVMWCALNCSFHHIHKL